MSAAAHVRLAHRRALWVGLGTTVLFNGLLMLVLNQLNRPYELPPEEPAVVHRLTQPPRSKLPTVAAVRTPTPSMAAPAPAAMPAPPLPRLELPTQASGAPLPLPVLPALDLARPVDLTVAAVGLPSGSAGDLAPVADAQEVVDEPPVLINGFDLERFYPRTARLRGVEGSSTLRLELSADGRVIACIVTASDPAGVFENAAAALGRSLRFTPARMRGSPVPCAINQTIAWRLPK
jgi:TonB family protein